MCTAYILAKQIRKGKRKINLLAIAALIGTKLKDPLASRLRGRHGYALVKEVRGAATGAEAA